MSQTRSASWKRKLHGPRPAGAKRGKDMANGMEIEPVLSRLQVANILGISLPTLWRLANRGAFPRPIRISPGRVAWRASTVRDWLADRGNGTD